MSTHNIEFYGEVRNYPRIIIKYSLTSPLKCLHMQNAHIQIIMHVQTVSKGFLSVDTFYSIQRFCMLRVNVLIRLYGYAGCSVPIVCICLEDTFSLGMDHMVY